MRFHYVIFTTEFNKYGMYTDNCHQSRFYSTFDECLAATIPAVDRLRRYVAGMDVQRIIIHNNTSYITNGKFNESIENKYYAYYEQNMQELNDEEDFRSNTFNPDS